MKVADDQVEQELEEEEVSDEEELSDSDSDEEDEVEYDEDDVEDFSTQVAQEKSYSLIAIFASGPKIKSS